MIKVKARIAPGGCAVEDLGLRPLACLDYGFESRRGHGCLFLESHIVRSLRRAYHSSREVLPSVVCPTVMVNPDNVALAH
jgi:hypothetical protein